MTKLTEQLISFFETFGYLGLPGLLSDCIDEITAAFEEVWAQQGGGHNGKPHDGHLAALAAKARAEQLEPARR